MIEDYQTLNPIQHRVEDSDGLDDDADAVIVLDDYDYEGFDGLAQTPGIGVYDPAVALLGKYGQNEEIGYHELLHLFNAVHEEHMITGEWIWERATIMGPHETTCYGEAGENPRTLNPSGCNAGRVDEHIESIDE